MCVLVEGKKTEGSYLTPLRRELRDRVLVSVDETGGAPLTLVQRARAIQIQGSREERRGGGRTWDSVWCVFDRDEHPNIPAAESLAGQHSINIALSNPCIELWFLLHFEDQTAALERHDAQRRSRQHLRCDKTLDEKATSLLHAAFDQAKGRALALDAKHLGDGSPEGSNPSSGVWRLIDELRTIKHPG